MNRHPEAAALLRAVLLLLPALALPTAPAGAQDTPPFSEVRLRAALGGGGLDATTGTYWDLRREWSAEVAGSFHGGWLALQGDRVLFRGRTSDLPSVAGHLLAAGWKRDVELPLSLRAEVGGLLGGLWIEDEDGRMGEAEADLTLVGELAVTGPRLGPLRPFVRGRLRRAFFVRPLDLRTASAGLEWSGRLPRRLASALGGEGAAPPRTRHDGPAGDPAGSGGTAAREEGADPTGGDRAFPGAAADPGTIRTLTRAELDDAGVTRMGDLLRLLDGWSAASVDRYVWRLLPRAGGLFHDPHPKVLVDGIPVPIGVLGVAGLEHLPVSLADVDSVRVVEGPLLEGGEPAPGGLLHVHTRRPRGPGAAASHQEGNPVGDPGLLEHTPLGTPNVERIGRYTTLRLEAGGERGHALLGHGIAARFHTDWPERERVERTRAPVDADSWIRTARTGGTAGLSLPGGGLRMLAGATRTHDFFLLPVVGTEVLTRNDQDFVGLAGHHALPKAGALSYRATAVRRSLVKHDFDPRPGFGFRRRTLSGEVRWRGERAALGLHHDLREADARSGLEAERIHRSRLFGRYRLPADVRVEGSLSRVAGETGAAATAGRTWRPSPGTFVTARAGAGTGPFEEADDFAVWFFRGYRIPARPDLVLGPPAPPGRRSWLLADLRSGYRPGDGRLRLDGGLWVRRDGGVAFAAPRFRVEDVVPIGSDTVPFHAGQRGALVGAWARGEGPLGDDWRWGVAASRDALVAGSPAFREARDEVPAGEVSGWLLWRGLPDLSVRLSARRVGSSVWHRWERAGSGPGVRLPGATAVDVAVQKWAWEGRLRGLVVVRDLLDRDRRLHPIGISPGLRLLVRGEARLGGR